MDRDFDFVTHIISHSTLIDTWVVAEYFFENQKRCPLMVPLFPLCSNGTATAATDMFISVIQQLEPGHCWCWFIAELYCAVNHKFLSKGGLVGCVVAYFD